MYALIRKKDNFIVGHSSFDIWNPEVGEYVLEISNKDDLDKLNNLSDLEDAYYNEAKESIEIKKRKPEKEIITAPSLQERVGAIEELLLNRMLGD